MEISQGENVGFGEKRVPEKKIIGRRSYSILVVPA
jgi:hypothetical protein